MTDMESDLDRTLGSNGEISRDLVVSWIEDAQHLEILSKLYRLTGEGYSRIRPELGCGNTEQMGSHADSSCMVLPPSGKGWNDFGSCESSTCHH
jgi:hypothetical protein